MGWMPSMWDSKYASGKNECYYCGNTKEKELKVYDYFEGKPIHLCKDLKACDSRVPSTEVGRLNENGEWED